jgi:hypothetical protein
MKALPLFLLMCLLLAACQSEDHFKSSPLMGSWVEKNPHFGHASSITLLVGGEAVIDYWTGDGYEKHAYTHQIDERGDVILTSKSYGSQFRGVLNEAGEMGIVCFYPCIPENSPVTLFVKAESPN